MRFHAQLLLCGCVCAHARVRRCQYYKRVHRLLTEKKWPKKKKSTAVQVSVRNSAMVAHRRAVKQNTACCCVQQVLLDTELPLLR